MAQSAVFVIVAIVLFMYQIYLFIGGATFEDIFGLAVALDHSVFIGVITNLLIALGLSLSADRSSSGPALQLAFWGQNIGLVVFMAGLLTETPLLKQVGAPVMGLSILLALGMLSLRLRGSNLSAAER